MKTWKIFAAGAAYGLAMRLLFGLAPLFERASGPGDLGSRMGAAGPMLASFVVLVPILIGAFTVVAARERAPGFGFAIVGPWVPTLAFVAGTAILLIEGSVCIAMALPIFLALASVGGVVGWIVVKTSKPRGPAMNALLLLPLAAGVGETQLALPQTLARSSASVHIDAPPEAVWALINRATDIRPAEMKGGLAWRIGVPLPVEAITRATPAGRVRQLRWAGGVRFDEPITDWQENRYLRWTYDFRPDSFPPGTLDEHVLIGGRHFDLVDTSYALAPEAGGTRLDIVVDYRVGTHFNWYAAPVGRLVVDDAARAILAFYKRRCEQPAG